MKPLFHCIGCGKDGPIEEFGMGTATVPNHPLWFCKPCYAELKKILTPEDVYCPDCGHEIKVSL